MLLFRQRISLLLMHLYLSYVYVILIYKFHRTENNLGWKGPPSQGLLN